jgi:ACS family glucarate transporter-like MFS transporter
MSAERRTYVRFVLSFLLFALSGVAFLDRTNISIAGLQISSEYGLGNQHLGWIFSAFLVGYAGFQIPAGWLAARFGPRRVLAFGVLWWGIVTELTALLPTNMSHAVMVLIAIRFALGAGESVCIRRRTSLLRDGFPSRSAASSTGLFSQG